MNGREVGVRILVVDDVPVAQELLAGLLNDLGDVDCADDATGALDLVGRARQEQHPYDLVCIDIGLPDLDGLELLRRIRATEGTAGRAKVLIVTASDNNRDVLTAFRDQADAYLQKPFAKGDLDVALGRAGVTRPAPV